MREAEHIQGRPWGGFWSRLWLWQCCLFTPVHLPHVSIVKTLELTVVLRHHKCLFPTSLCTGGWHLCLSYHCDVTFVGSRACLVLLSAIPVSPPGAAPVRALHGARVVVCAELSVACLGTEQTQLPQSRGVMGESQMLSQAKCSGTEAADWHKEITLLSHERKVSKGASPTHCLPVIDHKSNLNFQLPVLAC